MTRGEEEEIGEGEKKDAKRLFYVDIASRIPQAERKLDEEVEEERKRGRTEEEEEREQRRWELKKFWDSDSLHFSPMGYDRIGEIIFEQLFSE